MGVDFQVVAYHGIRYISITTLQVSILESIDMVLNSWTQDFRADANEDDGGWDLFKLRPQSVVYSLEFLNFLFDCRLAPFFSAS